MAHQPGYVQVAVRLEAEYHRQLAALRDSERRATGARFSTAAALARLVRRELAHPTALPREIPLPTPPQRRQLTVLLSQAEADALHALSERHAQEAGLPKPNLAAAVRRLIHQAYAALPKQQPSDKARKAAPRKRPTA